MNKSDPYQSLKWDFHMRVYWINCNTNWLDSIRFICLPWINSFPSHLGCFEVMQACGWVYYHWYSIHSARKLGHTMNEAQKMSSWAEQWVRLRRVIVEGNLVFGVLLYPLNRLRFVTGCHQSWTLTRHISWQKTLDLEILHYRKSPIWLREQKLCSDKRHPCWAKPPCWQYFTLLIAPSQKF